MFYNYWNRLIILKDLIFFSIKIICTILSKIKKIVWFLLNHIQVSLL